MVSGAPEGPDAEGRPGLDRQRQGCEYQLQRVERSTLTIPTPLLTQCALPAPLTLTLHLPPPTLDLTKEEALHVRALSLFASTSEADELDERGCPKEKRSSAEEEEELSVKVIRALGAGA